MNILLYLTTVLIWGSTWIAIKWQQGPVPISQSIGLPLLARCGDPVCHPALEKAGARAARRSS